MSKYAIRLRRCVGAPGKGHKYTIEYHVLKTDGTVMTWTKQESQTNIDMRIRENRRHQISKDGGSMWVDITEHQFNECIKANSN